MATAIQQITENESIINEQAGLFGLFGEMSFARILGLKMKKLTKFGKVKFTENDESEDVIVIARERLRAAGRKRWKGVAKGDRSGILSAAGKASWADMTPEGRSAEMKRRMKVRKRNRLRKERQEKPSRDERI
jgi:hypothetical protein